MPFLLPEAEHHQLDPSDYRHARNRPLRFRTAVRIARAGLLLAAAFAAAGVIALVAQ